MAKLKCDGFGPDYQAPVLDDILDELKRIRNLLEKQALSSSTSLTPAPTTKAQTREKR